MFAASCANVGRISDVVSPEKVDKRSLKKLPAHSTSKYKIKVATVDSLARKKKNLMVVVDKQFSELSSCMKIKDGGKAARRVPVAAS